jgi:hypothetical protein
MHQSKKKKEEEEEKEKEEEGIEVNQRDPSTLTGRTSHKTVDC